MSPRFELRGGKEYRPDPELDQKWNKMTIAFYAVLGAAAGAAAIERLRGDEKKEMGSYFKTFRKAVTQMRRYYEDPATVLFELPENRTVTRLVAMASKNQGRPLHSSGDRLPVTIPPFVSDIRTYAMGGGLFFEEIDVKTEPGKERTISILAGGENALGLYGSGSGDIEQMTQAAGRSVRILSKLELTARMIENPDLIFVTRFPYWEYRDVDPETSRAP